MLNITFPFQNFKKMNKKSKTVLVNGCFDVIHLGHLKSLKKASKLGKLIVAINSDKSIKQLKGPGRPINNEKDRKEFLEFLSFIYKVIIFNEVNVCNVLKKIKPSIWAKSGYNDKTIDQEEKEMARSLGIKIVYLPLIKGHSSTNIINKNKEFEHSRD